MEKIKLIRKILFWKSRFPDLVDRIDDLIEIIERSEKDRKLNRQEHAAIMKSSWAVVASIRGKK